MLWHLFYPVQSKTEDNLTQLSNVRIIEDIIFSIVKRVNKHKINPHSITFNKLKSPKTKTQKYTKS